MAYNEEEEQQVHVYTETKLTHDYQPAFDVLKDLNLDHHISEEEQNFLRVK